MRTETREGTHDPSLAAPRCLCYLPRVPRTQRCSSEHSTSAPRPGHLPPTLPSRTQVVGRVPLAEPLGEPRHLAAQHLVLAQEAVVLQDQLVLCRARGPLVILLREQLLPVLSLCDRALGPACVANPTRRGDLGSVTLSQPPQPLPTSPRLLLTSTTKWVSCLPRCGGEEKKTERR